MATPRQLPRADAWWADLTEAQQDSVFDVWRGTHKWYVAADFARKECGVEGEISRGAFDRFTHWLRRQRQERRLVSAEAASIEAKELAAKASFSDETMAKAYGALGAEAYLATGDAKSAAALVNMSVKIASVSIEREKLRLAKAKGERDDRALALAREKFEAAERRENAARSALGDTKLTDAAKLAKMKEIFG